jgi:diguanylate cyclase (GGDEF)-like protein
VGLPRSRPLAWLLGALFAWLVIYEINVLADLAPAHGIVFGRAPHLVVSFGAGLVCALGALRHSGGQRVGWLLVALGIVAWTAGDVYWTTVLLDEDSIPVPSPSDIGYLLFPLLAFPGLLSVMRARVRDVPRLLWVDGLTAALATGAVAAAVVVPTVVAMADSTWSSIATNVAYPISDLILLGLVVGALPVRGWRIDGAWAFAGLSIVAFWVADTHYLFAIAADTYVFPDAFDFGWAVAFVGLGAASLQPAGRRTAAGQLGRRVAVLPLVFAASALGVLVYAGLHGTTPVAVGLATASMLAVGVRLALTFRENVAMLAATRREALTDALTGLGNRRALTNDLVELLPDATADEPLVLVLFDLDGFKHYNDCYGHPAGDDLLVRLGANLGRRVADHGRAYRMGGDEFCALLRPRLARAEVVSAHAAAALRERGEGFDIGSSHGFVVLPREATDPAEALRLADQRMYAQKHGGRTSAGHQSRDVLLRALAERNPDLGAHLSTVAELAVAVARKLGLTPAEVEQVRHAADLHDVGKVAIPDAILDKPGPLDADEWAFMRRHTIIGERIVAAAPALGDVALLVRASHERHDGGGYPDGLAGEEIPLGARIVAVCDSFDAMVADRPYRKALPATAAMEELERCAGTQFDPAVVAAFREAYAELAEAHALPRAA